MLQRCFTQPILWLFLTYLYVFYSSKSLVKGLIRTWFVSVPKISGSSTSLIDAFFLCKLRVFRRGTTYPSSFFAMRRHRKCPESERTNDLPRPPASISELWCSATTRRSIWQLAGRSRAIYTVAGLAEKVVWQELWDRRRRWWWHSWSNVYSANRRLWHFRQEFHYN